MVVILIFSLFNNLSPSGAEEISKLQLDAKNASNRFTTYVSPISGTKTIESTPEIQIKIVAPEHLKLSWMSMEINGKEINAYYDVLNSTLSYTPDSPLLPGMYDVKFHYQFQGFKAQYTATSFEIVKPFYDPFSGKDKGFLGKEEQEALMKLNEYRTALGLPLFTVNSKLTAAAQAQSNYHMVNNVMGHDQQQEKAHFTGVKPFDRATLFGYLGTVSEGISYKDAHAKYGITVLFDAPYHRLSIVNPNYLEVGVGFNKEETGLNNSTVVKYGTTKGLPDNDLIVYPYDGQQDAKVSWYVFESPNPLRFYGLSHIYTGYPISLSIHDDKTQELRIKSAKLVDSNGKDIPFYQVDSSLESEKKKHLFLFPKNILSFGQTYTVTVEGERITNNGSIPFSKKWSFKTRKDIAISSITSRLSTSGKSEFLRIKFMNGDFENVSYRLLDSQREVIKYNGETNKFYGTLENGRFRLEITSPSIPSMVIADVEVIGSFNNRTIKWQNSANSSVPPTNGIKININGKHQTNDQQPIIQNGRVLLPMRGIFESLGAEVRWNANTRTVTGIRDQRNVQLTIGNQTAYLNGQRVQLDVPSQIVNGRTLVPLRFIGESMGMNVEWDEQARTVYIK